MVDECDNYTDISLFDKVKVALKNDLDIVKSVDKWEKVIALIVILGFTSLSTWIMWSAIARIVLGVWGK